MIEVIVPCGECNKPIKLGWFTAVSRMKGSKHRLLFCNNACSSRYTNNRNTAKKPKLVKKCIHCRNQLTGASIKYCNSKCHSDFIYYSFIKKWLAGEVSGVTRKSRYGNNDSYAQISQHIRRYLIELHGEKCWQCDWAKIKPIFR